MKANKELEKFVDDFIRKTNLEKCPFLLDWFTKKLNEINKLPTKPERQGIPKGDPLPMPRAKVLLALYRVVGEDFFRLNQFAKAYQISYGSVRNWLMDRAMAEKSAELLFDYVNLYLKTYNSLLELEDDNLDEIVSLLSELKYYSKGLWLIIHHNLREADSPHFNLSGDDVGKFVKHHFVWYYYAITRLREVDLVEHQQVVEEYLETTKELFLNPLFQGLRNEIKKGNTIGAINRVDHLKREITDKLFPFLRWIIVGLTETHFASKT
jgi:hypothetical protein